MTASHSAPQITSLLALARDFQSASGIGDGAASFRIFGDYRVLGKLRDGTADLTVARYNAALKALYDRWPPGLARPGALTDALLAAGMGHVQVRIQRTGVSLEGHGAEARILYAAGAETATAGELAAIEAAVRRLRESMEIRAQEAAAA